MSINESIIEENNFKKEYYEKNNTCGNGCFIY